MACHRRIVGESNVEKDRNWKADHGLSLQGHVDIATGSDVGGSHVNMSFMCIYAKSEVSSLSIILMNASPVFLFQFKFQVRLPGCWLLGVTIYEVDKLSNVLYCSR